MRREALEKIGPIKDMVKERIDHRLVTVSSRHRSKSTILTREGSRVTTIKRATMITLIVGKRKIMMIFHKLDKAEEMAASTTGMKEKRRTEVASEVVVKRGEEEEEEEEDFLVRARDRSLQALRIQKKPNRKKCKFTQTNLSLKLEISVQSFSSIQFEF